MTSPMITKAMLLAAGLGTRLRPLTLATPKPLLPLNDELVIDHQLKYLASHGIAKVVINLHHLGDMIREHVGDGSSHGLAVSYSEEPNILGTGGGIKMAQPFFGNEPFVVLNADALIDADIGECAAHHMKSSAAATMVVKRIAAGDSYTPIEMKRGLVASFGRGDFFYTGLQVIGREMLDALPPAGTPACLIEDGYKKLLEKDRKIAAFVHRGYFNDLGTPVRYEQARRQFARLDK